MAQLRELQSLNDFLNKHAAMTVAVTIDEKGTLHAAALRYAHTDDPVRFYFITSKNSEKCKLLVKEPYVSCAGVIGTERGVPFTVQLRGTIKIVDAVDYSDVLEIYYKKRGNKHDDIDSPDNVLLEFLPEWFRFTDYSKGRERDLVDLP